MSKFDKFITRLDTSCLNTFWSTALLISILLSVFVIGVSTIVGGIYLLYLIFKYIPFLLALPLAFIFIAFAITIVVWFFIIE